MKTFRSFCLLALLTFTSVVHSQSGLIQKSVDAPPNRVAIWLQEEAGKRGYQMPARHDLQASLAKQGKSAEPTIVAEVCNAALAEQMLNGLPAASTMMPCRISVTQRKGMTTIQMLTPMALASLLT